MENKGFNENETAERNREAFQSKDWKEIREAMKASVKHFSKEPLQEYGEEWEAIVKTYLLTGYGKPEAGHEVDLNGSKYKVLKRPDMTVFYDADGNTLFDVENERLASEYNCLRENDQEPAHEEGAGDGGAVQGEEKKDTEDASGDRNEKAEKFSGVDSAVSRLQDELKNAKPKEFAEPVVEYLIRRCKESESLAADICQEHKTWEKCFDYIYSMAKKQSEGKCAFIQDEVVLEWAEDYYRKDDKAEEEEKAKKKAEAKAKQKKEPPARRAAEKEKPAKAPAEPKPSREKKEEKPKEQPKAKKSSGEMEGQMDMFSLFGM